MSPVIKDAEKTHWVYKMPAPWQPFLQLSRLDRPIGYWLLTLPGWIGLAFANLASSPSVMDIKWALLIFIGAIAMRGAGCTYNDIVDQDLDKQVDRTALRPLPAGTVSNKQAWIWLFAQCGIGLLVLLCLPRLAQIISLFSLPLVAAYPFMKRITWWPQLWLGLTLNWAVLVAYAAKTGDVSPAVFILYGGLIFWTVGYDTIYACQDIEDDAFIGIKSTARRFGTKIKQGVGFFYAASALFIYAAITMTFIHASTGISQALVDSSLAALLFSLHLGWQVFKLKPDNAETALRLFKSNLWAGLLLAIWLYPTINIAEFLENLTK